MGCVHDRQDAGVEAPSYEVEGFGVTNLADAFQDFKAVEVHRNAHLPLGEVVYLVESFLGMDGVGETCHELGFECAP